MTDVAQRDTTHGAALESVGATPALPTYLKQIWRMRDFLFALSAGKVRGEFENSLLGSMWLLINPLILSAIYFVVFGVLFAAAGSFENYVGFLIVGLLTFTYSSRTTTSATKALRGGAALIHSVRFPRAMIPLATVVTSLVTHGPAVVVMLAVALLTGEGVRLTWLFLPLALLLQTLFNAGLAFIASRLAFHFADMEQIVPHLLRLAMYTSGVMYGIERVSGRGPEWLEWVFVHNPFYVFMSLFRGSLLAEGPPANWPAATVWAVTIFIIGLWFFRGRELEYGHV